MNKEVLKAWFPDEDDIELISVAQGNTTETCLVKAVGRNWILRKLSSIRQAEWEYQIVQCLQVEKIVPEIVCTRSGLNYTQLGEEIYHLQRYVEGYKIHKCEERTIISVAKTVAQMHKLLAEQKELEAGEDRFSLMTLWEKATENRELLVECLEDGELSMRQLEQELGELAEVEQRQEQLIHGDLGIWNMIENTEGVYVIDFGESHLGNPYLDIAAVLTSMLGLQKDERKWKEYIEIFCETYEQYYRQIDRLQLRKAIRLWFVRGMLAILNANDMAEEQKKRIIRYYIKQMNSQMIL